LADKNMQAPVTTSSTQADKALKFVQLHRQDSIFVLPNPWDVGSARMLAGLGFDALATTSAGFSFSQGRIDRIGETSLEQALAHARDIVSATPLPVSADLENGYGDSPDAVQATIRAAAAAGLVGCTIEDTTGNERNPIYDKAFAIERIRAAVEAVKSLDFPFTLTARAENYLHGRPDLAETIERLQGYEAVGADVLYAPGLRDIETIKTVCQSVGKPVNVVAGIGLSGVTVDDFEKVGVKRISLGSALARMAIGSFLATANNIKHNGRFDQFEHAAGFSEIEALLQRGGHL